MHQQGLFRNEELQPKKQENLVDVIFYKKKKEKVDLNYVAYGRLVSKDSSDTRSTEKKPQIVRLFVNEDGKHNHFEYYFIQQFLKDSGMDYQVVRSRAESLINCKTPVTEISFRCC